MFSAVFAGSVNRGSASGGDRGTAATAETKGNRLEPIFSGDVDESVSNGNVGGGGATVPSSSSQGKKKGKKKKRRFKKRSPWLSAPMILSSEVASNIA